MTTTDLKLLTEAAEGPWDVAIEQGCHAIVASVLPEGANIIAIIFNSLDTPEREPLRFANARLIALAPTLAEKAVDLFDVARSCGWVWPFAGCAIITDRPSVISFDDQKLLHSETGPAIEYRDGFAVHAWHGVRIPAEYDPYAELARRVAD